MNGETIVFGTSGSLLQGQHRLTACVRANVGFKTIIVRNVPDRVMYSIDRGKARSFADQLATTPQFEGRLRDPKNVDAVAALLKKLDGLDEMNFDIFQGYTQSEIDWVEDVITMIPTKINGLSTKGSMINYPLAKLMRDYPKTVPDCKALSLVMKHGENGAIEKSDVPIANYVIGCHNAIVWFLRVLREQRIGSSGGSVPSIVRTFNTIFRTTILMKKRIAMSSLTTPEKWYAWSSDRDAKDSIDN